MKNLNQLRDILSEEIDSLRAKKTTAENVNAICNATGKFLSSIKLELEYAKIMGKQPNIKVLTLGGKPIISDKPAQKKAA